MSFELEDLVRNRFDQVQAIFRTAVNILSVLSHGTNLIREVNWWIDYRIEWSLVPESRD